MLYADVMRLKRVTGALASVDSAQCYDRIVHSILSLFCQFSGVPISSIMCMLSAIQGMSFYLQTADGDSKSSFWGTEDKTFQGSCQVNGASTGLWLLISTMII